MNMNDVQTEPLPVQPGSYSADALAASMAEKFEALFRQVHPPIVVPASEPFRRQEWKATPAAQAGETGASSRIQVGA